MSDQQNNHREVSASELLQRLDQELHADKRDKTASSVSSDAAKNVTNRPKKRQSPRPEGFLPIQAKSNLMPQRPMRHPRKRKTTSWRI